MLLSFVVVPDVLEALDEAVPAVSELLDVAVMTVTLLIDAPKLAK
jgi:hypothetical protein